MAQSSSVDPPEALSEAPETVIISKCINNSFGLIERFIESAMRYSFCKNASFVAALIRFRCASFPVVPEVGGRKKQTLFWTFGWKPNLAASTSRTGLR